MAVVGWSDSDGSQAAQAARARHPHSRADFASSLGTAQSCTEMREPRMQSNFHPIRTPTPPYLLLYRVLVPGPWSASEANNV